MHGPSEGSVYLLSNCNALDMGAKVEPQSEQAWQGLEDVAVAVLNRQAIVANDLWQYLQVRLILS